MIIKVVAELIDVKVEANWKDKGEDRTQSAETPWQLEVPKNVKVRFTFKKDGYENNVQDVIADAGQTVSAKLVAIKAAAPKVDKEKKKKSPTESTGDTIEVDF